MQQQQYPARGLWWQAGVIYQIYPRSFMDGNGDGIGDLPGIISRLDYLSWLGIDAIWISPIYASPMVDFGYDVSNYVDIDPIFGDLATFDRLVAEAHRRDIKIIMDYVPSHTSDQHPWFLEARSSRSNPRRNWYVWADAKPDGSPPNNWLANWGGSSWQWDEATQQYYLHSYHVKMPDLNWRNPEVQAALFDVARFWLDRGVDGLRIDSAQRIIKDPLLTDNPPNPDRQALAGIYKMLGEYDSQLHVNDKGHPDIHAVYRELRQLLDSYGDTSPRMMIGEMHIFDWSEWVSYFGANLDEMHMPLNVSLLGLPWRADALRQVIATIEGVLPPGAWPNYVLSNHDEHRLVSRVGAEQARIAMMLLLTLRGTPTIYYGDEIGMHDITVPPELVQDPWEISLPGSGLGRDPERSPMQWDGSPNAGFCPPDVKPWLPVAADYPRVNVAVQRSDPHSLLTLTRALLELRRATSALSLGSYASIESTSPDCLVYQRQYEQQRCLVALNFSNSEQHMSLPGAEHGRILLSTCVDRQEAVDMDDVRLRGYEGVLIECE